MAPKTSDLLTPRKGFTVSFPGSVGGTGRGGPGTIIPADDPLLGNQRDFCELAPAGAEVTPHGDRQVAAFYAQCGYTQVPFVDPSAPKATPEMVEAANPPPGKRTFGRDKKAKGGDVED